MDRLTRVAALLVGVIGASAGMSAALVACGTTSPGTGGPDGATEGSADHHAPTDTSTHDSGHDVTGHHDTGVDGGIDTGSDSGMDTGTDTGVDSGKDGGRDAGRDGGHDAGFDAMGAAEGFPTAVIQAYCKRMSQCCVGDASTKFDYAGCVADNVDTQTTPLVNLGPLLFRGLSSTQYAFDEANAAACLSGFAALSCGTNPAGTINNLVTTCSSAYTPLATLADPKCASMFDCPAGTYCAPLAVASNFDPYVNVDGGVGTCVALKTEGQPCVDYSYSSDCNYQSGQVNALYCNFSGDSGTCAAPKANGASCSTTIYGPECQSGQCVEQPDNSTACATTVPFNLLYGIDQCHAYSVDAGG